MHCLVLKFERLKYRLSEGFYCNVKNHQHSFVGIQNRDTRKFYQIRIQMFFCWNTIVYQNEYRK